MTPLERFLTVQSPAPHRIAYYEWGNPAAPAVLCVHGLTRNGRDFDLLAASLAEKYRVISVDMPGRGKSETLADPLHYNYFTYIADIQALLTELNIQSVHWVGTSMGGIIAMMLAGAMPGTIRSLVLNDVGCLIPAAGLKRILNYAGVKTAFASELEAQSTLRQNCATFGIHDEAHWQHLFRHSIIEENGVWKLAYDPAIMSGFIKPDEIADVNLWATWEAISKIPLLVVRGTESDILPREVAQQMQSQHARLELYEVANTGHAPALMSSEQINRIGGWISAN